MNGRAPTQQLEGTVEATNAKGLKVGGAWVNVSQFRPVELPEAGAQVRVEVDSKGFIRELEVLGGSKPGSPALVRDDRDVRLAVLGAAASFVGRMGQCREEVRSDHVLPFADKWFAWVERASG